MHYVLNRGRQPIPDGPATVSERVATDIVPRVPEDHWKDTEEALPLRHAKTPEAIFLALWPHCTGGLKSDAVYVLECIQTPNPATNRAMFTKTTYWNEKKARAAKRLIYVGRAARVFERLNQHLNHRQDGANFTQVYPPIRVLDVSWWRQVSVGDAEKEVARQLQEEFPEDYVVQA